MNKKIVFALLAGAASGLLVYKLAEKILHRHKKRSKAGKNDLLYTIKRKDPYAWGEYTL